MGRGLGMLQLQGFKSFSEADVSRVPRHTHLYHSGTLGACDTAVSPVAGGLPVTDGCNTAG